jgi:hypothetical protein
VGKESGRHEGAEGAKGARPVADAIELRLTGATSERVSLGGDGAEAVFHALNAPTGGGSPSSRAASASAPGGTTSRAQRRAQVRSRRSQSRAWRQPGGAPASIVSSMGELGPVQLAQHGQRGEAACRGLVRRRQVVQMEQVGGARAGAREQLGPGSDESFVGGIVDGGKDAVGRVTSSARWRPGRPRLRGGSTRSRPCRARRRVRTCGCRQLDFGGVALEG